MRIESDHTYSETCLYVVYMPYGGHEISTYNQRYCAYYQGWFVYMKYTQGQNEEYLLSRSMY